MVTVNYFAENPGILNCCRLLRSHEIYLSGKKELKKNEPLPVESEIELLINV